MIRTSEDEAPRIPGYPIADMASGLIGTIRILGALVSRQAGTGGEHIDLSMTDVTMSLSQIIAHMAFDGQDPRLGETVLTGKYPCYDSMRPKTAVISS